MEQWGSKYKDNPAMIEGAIPDLQILNEERNQLLNIIKNTGNKVVEVDFPNEFDSDIPLRLCFYTRLIYFKSKRQSRYTKIWRTYKA